MKFKFNNFIIKFYQNYHFKNYQQHFSDFLHHFQFLYPFILMINKFFMITDQNHNVWHKFLMICVFLLIILFNTQVWNFVWKKTKSKAMMKNILTLDDIWCALKLVHLSENEGWHKGKKYNKWWRFNVITIYEIFSHILCIHKSQKINFQITLFKPHTIDNVHFVSMKNETKKWSIFWSIISVEITLNEEKPKIILMAKRVDNDRNKIVMLHKRFFHLFTRGWNS